MTVEGSEQGKYYQKIVYNWLNSISVQHGMFHYICVVNVCLKNLSFTFFYFRPNLILFNVLSVYPCGCFRTKLNRLLDMQCSSLLLIASICLFILRF